MVSCVTRTSYSLAPMASKKAYVDHLRSVPLFAACTRKELELIARSGDEITMTAGTVLLDQG